MTLAAKALLTYADYLALPDEERWELIEGVAHDMTPAPSTQHQRTLLQLAVQLEQALESSPFEVFVAPFDVRLPEGGDTSDAAIRSVVQPDLSIVCDPDKIDDAGCLGAPDLVIEVLSPSTAYRDQTEKLSLYEKHGVREYWIVNLERTSVLVYLLADDGAAFGKAVEYRSPERLQAHAVPGLEVLLEQVFRSR